LELTRTVTAWVILAACMWHLLNGIYGTDIVAIPLSLSATVKLEGAAAMVGNIS